MNTITNILYWLSTGLLVPVIILLIFLFLKSLVMIGSFFAQYQNIRKNNSQIQEIINKLNANNILELKNNLPDKNKSLAINYIKNMLGVNKSKSHINLLLANFEIEADKDLFKSKTLAKLGPILGLMGTLIPMGPALVGLSTGDIASMAYNMQVAFSTGVIGLFAGAIGLMTQQVKRRWYLKDMANLEFIANLLTAEQGETNNETKIVA